MIEPLGGDRFTATGVSAEQIGRIAARHAIELHELTPVTSTLEEAYLELTRDHVEYVSV